MRVIIAGSRTVEEISEVIKAIDASGFDIKTVLCGEAKGPDRLGKFWANLKDIPVESYIAQWSIHGKAAGFLRNEEMAKHADALIAIWDGESKGTADMIERAKKYNLKIYIHKPQGSYPV